jgi:hypothetical protein
LKKSHENEKNWKLVYRKVNQDPKEWAEDYKYYGHKATIELSGVDEEKTANCQKFAELFMSNSKAYLRQLLKRNYLRNCSFPAMSPVKNRHTITLESLMLRKRQNEYLCRCRLSEDDKLCILYGPHDEPGWYQVLECPITRKFRHTPLGLLSGVLSVSLEHTPRFPEIVHSMEGNLTAGAARLIVFNRTNTTCYEEFKNMVFCPTLEYFNRSSSPGSVNLANDEEIDGLIDVSLESSGEESTDIEVDYAHFNGY